MNYLVFTTEAVAKDALEVVYANMIKAVSSPDLLNVTTAQVVDKAALTIEEAVQIDASLRNFPIFGTNAASGVKNEIAGYTTAWAVAQETVVGKWVFLKPDDNLLLGVTGYTVEPYNPNWFPVE